MSSGIASRSATSTADGFMDLGRGCAYEDIGALNSPERARHLRPHRPGSAPTGDQFWYQGSRTLEGTGGG